MKLEFRPMKLLFHALKLLGSQVPCIQTLHPFLNFHLMVPAQSVQFRHISQLSHRSVRLGGIETDFPLKANRLLDQRSQSGYRNFFPGTDVDMAIPDLSRPLRIGILKINLFHNKDRGIGHLFTPKELTVPHNSTRSG